VVISSSLTRLRAEDITADFAVVITMTRRTIVDAAVVPRHPPRTQETVTAVAPEAEGPGAWLKRLPWLVLLEWLLMKQRRGENVRRRSVTV